jgi:pyridoxine 5-phosphate synthase
VTKLSVNVNKFATLRNARGGNNPNIAKAAADCEQYGADGVTVHPRPDERHIRYADARELKNIVTTEFNIEGNPRTQKFIDLVLEVKPTQVTLVPDAENALTSNQGWDTLKHKEYLTDIITVFKNNGIRTSIFIDPVLKQIEGAVATGTDRVELYTEAYAHNYKTNREQAIAPYREAAFMANNLGLGINAGHDLDLENLRYFKQNIPGLLEVSIGHALICDAIYLGFNNAIQMYKRCLV